MRNTFVAVLLLGAMSAAAQTAAYKAPRGPDGHPDINGIWQALNTANWNLEGHAAQASQVIAMGAIGLPEPPVMRSGAATKRNSVTASAARSDSCSNSISGTPPWCSSLR